MCACGGLRPCSLHVSQGPRVGTSSVSNDDRRVSGISSPAVLRALILIIFRSVLAGSQVVHTAIN